MNKSPKMVFRCTRPDLYPPNSQGHIDKSIRTSFYIRAEGMSQALDEMRARFPHDSCFDIEVPPGVGDF